MLLFVLFVVVVVQVSALVQRSETNRLLCKVLKHLPKSDDPAQSAQIRAASEVISQTADDLNKAVEDAKGK